MGGIQERAKPKPSHCSELGPSRAPRWLVVSLEFGKTLILLATEHCWSQHFLLITWKWWRKLLTLVFPRLDVGLWLSPQLATISRGHIHVFCWGGLVPGAWGLGTATVSLSSFLWHFASKNLFSCFIQIPVKQLFLFLLWGYNCWCWGFTPGGSWDHIYIYDNIIKPRSALCRANSLLAVLLLWPQINYLLYNKIYSLFLSSGWVEEWVSF